MFLAFHFSSIFAFFQHSVFFSFVLFRRSLSILVYSFFLFGLSAGLLHCRSFILLCVLLPPSEFLFLPPRPFSPETRIPLFGFSPESASRSLSTTPFCCLSLFFDAVPSFSNRTDRCFFAFPLPFAPNLSAPGTTSLVPAVSRF